MLDLTHTKTRVNSGMRVRCEPSWRLDPAWSDNLTDCDYWFVWAGRGRMRLRDRAVTLRPGVLVWARPGGRYLAEHNPEDPLGVTAVHFDVLDKYDTPIPASEHPGEIFELADIAFVDTTLRQVIALIGGGPGVATTRVATDATRAMAGELLGTLLRLTVAGALAPPPGRPGDADTDADQVAAMMSIADRIAAAPAAAPSVAELAEAAGYSADHFTRLFRRVIGQTPSAYLVNARIQRARQLLAETALSVTQIADALGYADVYFFSRQFKQVTSVSPTAWRRRTRG